DYLDAFEKLNHLDLRNNQDREIIHLALQYNLWDRLKDLNFEELDKSSKEKSRTTCCSFNQR
ncbi:Nucleolar MIF4G domain-containing protein 1, partial [Orchesella cincta]